MGIQAYQNQPFGYNNQNIQPQFQPGFQQGFHPQQAQQFNTAHQAPQHGFEQNFHQQNGFGHQQGFQQHGQQSYQHTAFQQQANDFQQQQHGFQQYGQYNGMNQPAQYNPSAPVNEVTSKKKK